MAERNINSVHKSHAHTHKAMRKMASVLTHTHTNITLLWRVISGDGKLQDNSIK